MPKTARARIPIEEPGERPVGSFRPSRSVVAAPTPARGAAAGTVVLAGTVGEPIRIPFSRELDAAAQEWERIVLNRVRWRTSPDVRRKQADHSKDALRAIGIDPEHLVVIAAGGVIQVSIPYVREGTGWAARIFPWEYVLTSAVSDRIARPLLVVRHLQRAKDVAPRIGEPETGLIVESAPGAIRYMFDFKSERRLVRANLGPGVKLVRDPTLQQVRKALGTLCPGTIHLAGLDSHQGASLLGQPEPHFDGYYVADDLGQPTAVRAEELADAVARIGPPDARMAPRLVACNFEWSAARVAALVVADGAEAAIGFQDVVDEALAELFFTRFYANWKAERWQTALAFARTIDQLRTRPGVLSGLGIVLWSATDILTDGSATAISRLGRLEGDESNLPATDPTDVEAGDVDGFFGVVDLDENGTIIFGAAVVPAKAAPATPGDVADGAATERAVVSGDDHDATAGPPPATAGGDAGGQPIPPSVAASATSAGRVTDVEDAPLLWVDPHVVQNVNYVHLHNNGSLFSTFRLRRSTQDVLNGVKVEVTFYVGRRSFPYQATLSLSEPSTELRDRIRVPLTSELLRSVHESIQSVVYVLVKHGDRTIWEDTYPIMITSADEWVDTDEETRWLPSFVLPRDPAVDEVRRAALPALRALDDTFGGGFLGYQALGDDDDARRIDIQAAAIWSALSFLYDLSYVNPPPTYTEHAQRLRSPTEVARSRSGTCIDLALLYAACLEAIDLWPVIMMYEGHANVGYWRSPRFHDDFQTMRPPSAGRGRKGALRTMAARELSDRSPRSGNGRRPKAPQLDPWEIRRESDTDDANLAEVQARVDRQQLVILETTLLTEHSGFGQAILRGQDSFRDHAFRSLVDIRIARQLQVTPLPIVFE